MKGPLPNTAGSLDTVRLLLDHGLDITARASRSKWSALHFASFAGRLETVKLLLTQQGSGAVNQTGVKQGPTALHLAVRSPDVVRYLLQHDANTQALCRYVPGLNSGRSLVI